MTEETTQEIPCEACDSIWIIEVPKRVKIVARLIQCPLCAERGDGNE